MHGQVPDLSPHLIVTVYPVQPDEISNVPDDRPTFHAATPNPASCALMSSRRACSCVRIEGFSIASLRVKILKSLMLNLEFLA
jgi:hypothetical protein